MIDFNKKNIWIYGVGSAGKWLSDNTSSVVKGFVDRGSAKQEIIHNKLKVFTPEEAINFIKEDDLIIISVLDIQDVIPVVERNFKNNKWFAMGEFLNNQRPENNFTGDSNKYLEYTLNAVELCHKNYLAKNDKFLHSVDIVISEKCSLNCKDCSNLMQYYKQPLNLSYELITKDFESLMQKIDHVYEVRLIGGEPFMNKDIYKIINYFLESKKITKIVIYTNATIPLKKDEMLNYSTPKLVFSITDYGKLSKNTEKVILSLQEMQIAYRSMPPNNWTDSAIIKDNKRTEDGMRDIFERCCGKNLFTIMYGKLYRCPFVSNAERLHAIPYDNNNGIDLNESLEKIVNYTTKINYLPACNFCNGRSHDAPEIEPAIQAKGKLSYKEYN